jgi:hypothetical protein
MGYKIGPLFSENFIIAELLFKRLCASVEKAACIYLDIPEINNEALQLAEKYSMKKVFRTARMYAGEFPALPIDKIYGVSTFELG